MALIEYTLLGAVDKVTVAIKRLRAFEPPDGYWLAYSGGKDSVVIKRLAEMASVKYEAHYSVTSVDPPELVRFIKQQKDVNFDIPHDKDGKPITMWNLIPKKKMPPTRLMRYCCDKLKESNGIGSVTVTGVRWAESVGRKNNQGVVTFPNKKDAKELNASMPDFFAQTARGGVIFNTDNDDGRRIVEQCYRTKKVLCNPIIDWTDNDVWEFIRAENVPYCGLYDCGYKRLGCIGCPMNTNAAKELDAYPKYKANYLKAFERMLNERRKSDLIRVGWNTAEEVMDWWLYGAAQDDSGQLALDLYGEE